MQFEGKPFISYISYLFIIIYEYLFIYLFIVFHYAFFIFMLVIYWRATY